MKPTIASILAALSNVGKAPVTVRLDPQLFPVGLAHEAVARQPHALALNEAGELTVLVTGHDGWQALREFTQDILAAALTIE